MVASFNALAE